MFGTARPYQWNGYFSAFLFLVTGVWAISHYEPFWLLVPFVWLLFPAVIRFVIHQPAILFWAWLVCLPLSTELNLTPSLGLDFPGEILLIILTAAVLIRWLYQPLWVSHDLIKHPLFLVLLIYLLWIGITCLYSVETVLSVKYLLAKIWYIVPLLILPQMLLKGRTDSRKLALSLLVPMAFVVVQTLFRHALYGFRFDAVQKTMAPFFRNHVNYSALLVCLLPVAGCLWMFTPIENKYRKRIGYGILLGMAGVFFAYSRGAWIALLAGLAIIPVIRYKKTGILVTLSVSIIMATTAWLVTDENYIRFSPEHDQTVFHTDFSEHMLATVQLKDVSTAERFYRWIAGVKMLAEKPITGFGPGSFYLHYRPYTVSSFETWVSNNPEHSTVHNYFILIALEQGLIGLLLFCALYFGMLFYLQSLYHRLQDPLYRTMAISIAMILVMIGVINSMSDMIETDKIGGLFWLCLGMVIWLERKSREEREELVNIEQRMSNIEHRT
jgi:O-antigen ligase